MWWLPLSPTTHKSPSVGLIGNALRGSKFITLVVQHFSSKVPVMCPTGGKPQNSCIRLSKCRSAGTKKALEQTRAKTFWRDIIYVILTFFHGSVKTFLEKSPVGEYVAMKDYPAARFTSRLCVTPQNVARSNLSTVEKYLGDAPAPQENVLGRGKR